MSKLKYIFIYLIVIFFFGCKTKEKSIEYIEKVKTDSTKTELTLKSESKYKIDILCDPVTGLPKDFTRTTDNGIVKTKTEVKDNKYTYTEEIDSTKQETKIVKEYITVYKDKIITKEVYPLWLVISIPLLVLLFLFKERIPLINLIKF